VREAVGLAAAVYVVGFLLAQRWRRRDPGRVVVLCPLREAELPTEIAERLGAPRSVGDLGPFLPADLTIGYLTDAPGISLASITDEPSLRAAIGPYARDPLFAPGPDRWRALLARPRWTAGLLFALALEVLHRSSPPRTLLVDFRPPPKERARALAISAPESDLDLGMYAYEIRCRLRRYSRYCGTPCFLLFWRGEGEGWVFEG
jgi:hypothetical protein